MRARLGRCGLRVGPYQSILMKPRHMCLTSSCSSGLEVLIDALLCLRFRGSKRLRVLSEMRGRQPCDAPACGYLCAPDFAFCPQCGAPSALRRVATTGPSRRAAPQRRRPLQPIETRQSTEADRRPVTVLFADLCGFTTLSERLDPEDVQALQNQLFEEMTAAVHRFGGFVDKFIGDALLALFGAPAAHEDDPERALRAALDMIERTAHVSER